MYKFKNVVVGISGGVDSAVAALLLKRKGYIVQGVFMQNWDIFDEHGFCSVEEDFKDASLICNKLDIPLYHVNFVKEYWNDIFIKLVKDYEDGYTPNPDILCNRYIKFNYLYKYAIEKLNADAIATGHYARTNFGPFLENFSPNADVKLLKAHDNKKDQTFFLCQIQQHSLRKTMFPLGNITKQEVKSIAMQNNLEAIASKKESMGICFIGSRKFQHFISQYIQNKPGKFVDIDTGLEVGEHNGIHQWTLGQRSRIPGIPEGYFIAHKDVTTNTIYVAMGTNHPALYATTFFTAPAHWIYKKPAELSKSEIYPCQFKFQHTHGLVDCELCDTPKGLIVRSLKPKRALTPGQYAVFYKNDECLGSAEITHPGPSNFLIYYLHNKLNEKNSNETFKLLTKTNKSDRKCDTKRNKLNRASL